MISSIQYQVETSPKVASFFLTEACNAASLAMTAAMCSVDYSFPKMILVADSPDSQDCLWQEWSIEHMAAAMAKLAALEATVRIGRRGSAPSVISRWFSDPKLQKCKNR